MEFHLLLILLVSFAKAARGLKEQPTTYDGSAQYDVRRDGNRSEGIVRTDEIGDGGGGVEQDSLPWSNLEELAELEKKAEYTIKVIILTMNRCACQDQSLPS